MVWLVKSKGLSLASASRGRDSLSLFRPFQESVTGPDGPALPRANLSFDGGRRRHTHTHPGGKGGDGEGQDPDRGCRARDEHEAVMRPPFLHPAAVAGSGWTGPGGRGKRGSRSPNTFLSAWARSRRPAPPPSRGSTRWLKAPTAARSRARGGTVRAETRLQSAQGRGRE